MLESFRELQLHLFPQLSDRVKYDSSIATLPARDVTMLPSISALSLTSLEDQSLTMPSDFSKEERETLGLGDLAKQEYRLVEGATYDYLSKVRSSARYISALDADKKANVSGQGALTRAQTRILDAKNRLEFEIAFYNALRNRLILLGLPRTDPTFRPLNIESTYRTAVHLKRQTGTTYKPDGMAWTHSGPTQRGHFEPLINPQQRAEEDPVATQSNKALKRQFLLRFYRNTDQFNQTLGKNKVQQTHQAKKLKGEPESLGGELSAAGSSRCTEAEQPHSLAGQQRVETDANKGWIWDVVPPQGLTATEVEEWLSEGLSTSLCMAFFTDIETAEQVIVSIGSGQKQKCLPGKRNGNSGWSSLPVLFDTSIIWLPRGRVLPLLGQRIWERKRTHRECRAVS